MTGKLSIAAALLVLNLSGANRERPALTTAAQVHRLSSAAANQHLPVIIRGVVTQFIPEWNGFSLQDKTDALYVMGPQVRALPLKPGTIVEVRGTSAPGNYAPLVDASDIKIIRTGSLPTPYPADWKYISSGSCDNDYVSVVGVVRAVLPVASPRWRWPATAIHIDVGGNMLWAYARQTAPLPEQLAPDALALVSGTCIVLANSRKRFEGISLLVSDTAKGIHIVEPDRVKATELAVTAIDRIFVFAPGNLYQRRVRINGVVVWADATRVFLQDSKSGVLVRTVSPTSVQPGDVVDAVGFPSAGAYAAEMDDSILLMKGKQANVAPLEIKATDLIARFREARPFLPDSMLVRMNATVLGVSHSTQGLIYALRDGTTVFSALLQNSKPGATRSNVKDAERVAITGVCLIQPDDLGLPQSFQLLMRSGSDVRVIAKPSWLTRSLALRTASLLLGIALASLLVVVFLSHRVGKQSTLIEEQKRREEELGQRMRELVENASDLVYILDIEGRILHVNYGAERLTGYSRKEQLALNIADLIVPSQRPMFRQTLAARPAEEGSKFEQSEWTLSRKDGTQFTVELNQRFVAANGGPLRVEAIGRDVTARKQAMFDNQERFRTLADNIPQLAWMADESGSMVWYNERWFEYTGGTLLEARGWGWLKWHHPDHLERVAARMRQCFGAGEAWEDIFPLRGRDGQFCWFLGRGIPIRDENGKVVRWFGTNTDITDQKRTETELKRSNEDLRQFAYIASHDLQEPLRNVCTFAQMLARTLADGDLTPERAMYIDVVTSGARRMEALISDLLAYSRATAGEAFDRAPISITAVVRGVLEGLRSIIEESEATIDCADLPTVLGNPMHMTQVLQNLITNAIKYRRPDVSPVISVRAEKQVDFWLFSVADNGSGFDPQYSEKMFGIFKRLHGREIPGTGIGLAICRAIVERHGGRIWAEGRPGAGSTFWFTIPVHGTEDPLLESKKNTTADTLIS